MKRIIHGMAAVLVAVLWVLPAGAATVGTTAGNWSETLADSVGGVSYTGTDSASLTVTFAAQGAPPSPCSGGMIAGPESAFTGDLAAARAQAIAFKIAGTGPLPSYALVFLRGRASGRFWYTTAVQISAESGLATLNTVSLDRAAGGWRTDYGSDPAALWAQDLQDVAAIGISLGQGGTAAQSYTISDFMLINQDGGTTSGVLTPLQQALKDRFGVTTLDALSEADLETDTDHDGMADVIEILSENDAAFAMSIFFAEIVDIEPGKGILIRWPCVNGGDYTVFRGSDLAVPFTSLAGAANLTATETGFMTYRDMTATGDGPYYYKIGKQQ